MAPALLIRVPPEALRAAGLCRHRAHCRTGTAFPLRRIGGRARLSRFNPGGAAADTVHSLIDAAMPPITRGLSRAREIGIDDALGGAARCRRVALRQRRIGAFVIAAFQAWVHVQANYAGSYVGAAAGPAEIVPIAKIAK